MNDPLADLAPTLKKAPDQHRQYLPTSHQQLLDKLEHISRFSALIQILTGPQGSGKSTLLNKLGKKFSTQEALTFHFKPNYETTAGEFLSQLASHLDVSVDNSATAQQKLLQLQPKLLQVRSQNLFLLLLIDNGECLSDSLQTLLFEEFTNLGDDQRPHLVIAAQPVFAERLQNSAHFNRHPEDFGHFAEIPPLSLEETQEFLLTVHPEEAELLSEKRIDLIRQRSFGLPGLIEKALEQELSHPGQVKNPTKPGRILVQGLFALSLIGISAVAGYVLWSLYAEPDGQNEQVRVALPTPVDPLPTEPPKNLALPKEPVEPISEPEPIVTNEPEQAEIPAPQVANEPEASTPDNLDIASVVAPETEPTAEEEPPVLTTPAHNKLVLQLKPAQSKPSAQSTPEPVAETTTPIAPTAAPRVVKPPIIKARHPYLREQELLSWNTNGYTLQMLGARKEETVTHFLESRPDKNKFYYFSTIYKEKPWYVVVYGQYRNRDDAVAAISSLPTDLKKQKPWARSIKGVQEDIRRDK